MKNITLYNYNELPIDRRKIALEDAKHIGCIHFKDDSILSMLDMSKFKEIAEFNCYVTLDSKACVSNLYFKDIQDMFEEFYAEKCDCLLEDTIHVFRDMLNFIDFKIDNGKFYSRDLTKLKYDSDCSILEYIQDEQNFFETIVELFSNFDSYDDIESYLIDTLYDFTYYLTVYLIRFEEYINQTLEDNKYTYDNKEIFFFEDGTICE